VILLRARGLRQVPRAGPAKDGSRFARMPTSQNRDMGHPILLLSLDVSNSRIVEGFGPSGACIRVVR
jgi:hypothetical protein